MKEKFFSGVTTFTLETLPMKKKKEKIYKAFREKVDIFFFLKNEPIRCRLMKCKAKLLLLQFHPSIKVHHWKVHQPQFRINGEL